MLQDFFVHVQDQPGFDGRWRDVFALTPELAGMLLVDDEGRFVRVPLAALRLCGGTLCRIAGCTQSTLCAVCATPNSAWRDDENRPVCDAHSPYVREGCHCGATIRRGAPRCEHCEAAPCWCIKRPQPVPHA